MDVIFEDPWFCIFNAFLSWISQHDDWSALFRLISKLRFKATGRYLTTMYFIYSTAIFSKFWCLLDRKSQKQERQRVRMAWCGKEARPAVRRSCTSLPLRGAGADSNACHTASGHALRRSIAALDEGRGRVLLHTLDTHRITGTPFANPFYWAGFIVIGHGFWLSQLCRTKIAGQFDWKSQWCLEATARAIVMGF